MITPVQSPDELLADVRRCRSADGLHLWWLGQSGFLVQHAGRHLLLDPYLSDSLTAKYAATDKPHVRMTSLVIDPRRLDFIDVVTSSHNHTDHLDAETLLPLLAANPRLELLTPAANRQFAAARLGLPEHRLAAIDAGESISLAGLTLHAIPAAHETIDRDEHGRCRYLGYVVELGPWRIYHAGDGVPFDGLVELLRPWALDVAILPINGRTPERRVPGNFWGREAAWLAKEIGAGCAIPCHYEMFAFNTASPAEFIAAATELQQTYRVLRAGERLSRTAARSTNSLDSASL